MSSTVTSNRYLFLVDDEPIQNEMLKDFLNERFLYTIKVFETGEDALQHMHLHPELMVLDYHLSSNNRNAKNGVEVLRLVKDQYPDTAVIMLSGQDKIDVAVDSVKFGAFDYIVKGETAFSRIENVINNISELHKVRTINKAYKNTIIFLSIGIGLIILLALYLFFFTTKLG